jgi:hypothetical protein
MSTPQPPPTQGTGPTEPFRRPQPQPNNPPDVQQPPQQNPPQDSASSESNLTAQAEPDTATLRLAPRIAPQPSTIGLKPGESKMWSVVGMDLDGLNARELVLHFNPRAMNVTDVSLGSAVAVDPALPPIVTVDANTGTIRVKSSNGKPLEFVGGGDVLLLRVHGGAAGETFLVMQNPEFHTAGGESVVAAVAGGRAKVQ